MGHKFKGKVERLREIVEQCGIEGDWSEVNEGQHQFRCNDGAILNFWPSNGTVHFQGKADAKKALEDAVAPQLGGMASSNAMKTSPATKATPQIFVVHGHDSEARDQLELVLRRLGLAPFILMNSSGGGKTIIEALEGRIGKKFDSDFGIALFTPDDFGYSAADGPTKAEPRARQNVVLETGMLLSSLTRARMAILVKGHLVSPSDLAGVIELRFNNHVREVVPKLVDRLREAGIEIDSAKISAASS